MCKLLILFVVLQVFSCYAEEETKKEEGSPEFRRDYKYIKDLETFYKIHTVHQTWEDAKKRCEMEGSQLFYPENKKEAEAVLAYWKDIQSFSWVYIGVSDHLTKGYFETIDGTPIQDVYHKWGVGEPNNAGGLEGCVILRRDGTLNDDMCDRKYPFICKKKASAVDWNKLCSVPDSSYVYQEKLNKCYKFHNKLANWTDAYGVCKAEQSYLVIPDDQAEIDYLVQLTKDSPKKKVHGRFIKNAVYIGLFKVDTDWKTIRGVPLEESGYSKWAAGQPDGGDKDMCGSMVFNGELNDLDCEQEAYFICEHDLPSTNIDQFLDEKSL